MQGGRRGSGKRGGGEGMAAYMIVFKPCSVCGSVGMLAWILDGGGVRGRQQWRRGTQGALARGADGAVRWPGCARATGRKPPALCMHGHVTPPAVRPVIMCVCVTRTLRPRSPAERPGGNHAWSCGGPGELHPPSHQAGNTLRHLHHVGCMLPASHGAGHLFASIFRLMCQQS